MRNEFLKINRLNEANVVCFVEALAGSEWDV